jgi:peroxiredoxin
VNCKIFLAGLSVFVATMFGAQDDTPPSTADVPPILKIGSSAPDFSLPGVDGKTHSLKDYAGSKILAVIFTCNHCPVAQMYEKRIKQLAADYQDKGVAIVAINPNDPKAVHLSEMGYTDVGDSLPEMNIRAQYRHLTYPYLSDGATQSVALKYGPTATPHAFIFDAERKLRYEGRIDSNPREELATKHEVRDALDALLAGRKVSVTDAPAVGCSTKWAYKEKGANSEISESQQQPITVDLASIDQLKALRKNNSGKLVLVNFWATWCGPCTAEFPRFQKMWLMYRKRPLEIVSVSINSPDEKDMVLKFLNEQHAITRNLLFNSNDPADAVTAFNGTQWTGGVPFTALISASGDLLYKTQGEINALDVERAILKNLPDDNYKGQHAYWNSSF